jgi:hypothetical protein
MPAPGVTPEEAARIFDYLAREEDQPDGDVGLLDVALVDPAGSAWVTVERELAPIADAGRHRLVGLVRARADRPAGIWAEFLVPSADDTQKHALGELRVDRSFRTFVVTEDFTDLPVSPGGHRASLALFLPQQPGLRVQFDEIAATILTTDP